MAHRWQFHDPYAGEDWTVPLNPNEMGKLYPQKNVTKRTTTAVDGKTLMFEGNTEPLSWQFSGALVSKEHYDGLLRWYQKRNRIQITDHLGRVIHCYIDDFDAEPQIVKHVVAATLTVDPKWRHDYTVSAIVFDVEEPSA